MSFDVSMFRVIEPIRVLRVNKRDAVLSNFSKRDWIVFASLFSRAAIKVLSCWNMLSFLLKSASIGFVNFFYK